MSRCAQLVACDRSHSGSYHRRRLLQHARHPHTGIQVARQRRRSPMPEKCNELFGTVTFLSFDCWGRGVAVPGCQHHKFPKAQGILSRGSPPTLFHLARILSHTCDSRHISLPIDCAGYVMVGVRTRSVDAEASQRNVEALPRGSGAT
jgi:hypothetical protein